MEVNSEVAPPDTVERQTLFVQLREKLLPMLALQAECYRNYEPVVRLAFGPGHGYRGFALIAIAGYGAVAAKGFAGTEPGAS
jgi:hypothetical protein